LPSGMAAWVHVDAEVDPKSRLRRDPTGGGHLTCTSAGGSSRSRHNQAAVSRQSTARLPAYKSAAQQRVRADTGPVNVT
jgi:hypothetical protein